ncbi:hypothetical protein ABKN59_011394 [Abortiporus biennis]
MPAWLLRRLRMLKQIFQTVTGIAFKLQIGHHNISDSSTAHSRALRLFSIHQAFLVHEFSRHPGIAWSLGREQNR